MSPNEYQLRAALHDGEGDTPDARVVIAAAQRVRAERRRRMGTIASAACVVALVGGGGTLIVRNAGDSGSAGGGGAAAGGAAAAPVAGAGGQATHGGNQPVPTVPAPGGVSAATVHGSASGTGFAARKASDLPCPAQFPSQLLPGGGGTDQFGADGALFAEPVAAMKVCEYPTGAGLDRATELSGTNAQQFAAELESAPLPGSKLDCITAAPSYALYPVAYSGHVMLVVTAEPGCLVYRVTNGSAVRDVPMPQFAPIGGGPVEASPVQGSPLK